MAFAAAADPVADDPRERVEAGGAVDTAFADMLAEQAGHVAAGAARGVKVERIGGCGFRQGAGLAVPGRHCNHCLSEVG